MFQSSRVGPYELISPLGAGGMAETFIAVKRGPAGFEQKVCLKRILHGHTADPSFVELFLDEARLLAQLSYAGIVQVYDFGEVDGTYYMALELVDGADLDAILRGAAKARTRLPVSVALYISAQLLGALGYAHDLSVDGEPLHIVHRDISPSNILLSRHGEVKLTDFGIAKSRNRTHRTQTGHTKGKVAYMSPEQVRGEALDARSDLFSAGVVVYELLTGRHPFDADTDLTLLNNILAGTRRSVKDQVPELSDEMALFVDRLLRVDPAERPASAAEALALIPFKEQPFVVQAQLAKLVTAHRLASPSRFGPLKPTPVAVPVHGSSDGSTAVLPAGKTPADRLAVASESRATTGRRSATTSDAVVVPLERRGLHYALIAAAALLIAVGIGVALNRAEPRRAAIPALPTPPVGAVEQPREPSIPPVNTGAPGSLPLAGAEPAVVEPAAPPPEPATPVVLHAAEPATERTRERAENSKTDRARKTRHEHSSPAAPSGPSTGAAKKPGGRSGLAVSPDDF